MELNKENMKKIKELVVFTAVLLIFLWQYNTVLKVFSYLMEIFLPFILGGAIGFILNVPTHFLEQHLFPQNSSNRLIRRISRPVSLILTLAAVGGIIGILFFIVTPQLGRTVSNLEEGIGGFLPKVQEQILIWSQKNPQIMEWVLSWEINRDDIFKQGLAFFGEEGQMVWNQTFQAARSVMRALATFFIGFAFACYLILQKEKLNLQVRKILFAFMPKGKAEAVLEVFSLTYEIFAGFLTGQCMEALILGGMFVLSMFVFGMPYPWLIGGVIACTALVPIFGAFIGCGLGVFLIFIEDPQKALWFVVLFLVLQQIEGNFIYPHVVGNSVGLPSIWVLGAVIIGGRLMGVVGMLIFIPLVSVGYALLREIVYLKLRKNGIAFTMEDKA